MNLNQVKTLLLNADGVPMRIIPMEKAIGMVHVKKTATEIDFYKNIKIKDASGKYYTMPAVIILKRFVKKKKELVPFSKRNIMLRDRCSCQYCGKKLTPQTMTYDHVIPRSKWKKETTPTCWDNIVCACFDCNQKKGNKTIEQAKMPLKFGQPKRPRYSELGVNIFCSVNINNIPDEWKPYEKYF